MPRAVCVNLGGKDGLAVCFDPETLEYPLVWQGGFVKFSSHRHGFLAGLRPIGSMLEQTAAQGIEQPFQYRGFYRVGEEVVFSYRIGQQEMLDWPSVHEGRFSRVVAPADQHPLHSKLDSAPAQWPQEFQTRVTHGNGSPYAVDTIEIPFENPWKALMFCSGHAFLPDGSALVCTMQGDVWKVSDFAYPSEHASWCRFASGLHHPLGIVIDEDGIFVQCRDQITRLHDLNGDDEADFYERFSGAFETSPAGHDFICGLQRDANGNFYTASGNQGLVKISPDGQMAEVVATGFRNPDGLGIQPDGTVTVPCSEGAWTPASMICAVPASRIKSDDVPHYGYRGPEVGRVPELPLVYLPRGLDNSSGGQVYVSGDQWGPMQGQLIHLSFGTGAHFLVLQDQVEDQLQGAIVPLPGEFRSGVHRARFHPIDGQMYVTGMQGWGSYTPDDGCFQRVRYTGDPVQVPVRFHVYQDGVLVSFSQEVDAKTATDPSSHFAQAWNYRYGPGYGSPEFSTRHTGIRGHDVINIESAQLVDDGRSLFISLLDLQPVNQLHLRLQSAPGQYHDLFVTVHRLDEPLDPTTPSRTLKPHPILADLAMVTRSRPNPFQKKLRDARKITIETGPNLSFATRTVHATAGEAIALTLANPDVVPHNWALLKPGTVNRVGALADQLISDPEAALRHYIPESTDILAHTDVVLPRDEFTIFFRAPEQPDAIRLSALSQAIGRS